MNLAKAEKWMGTAFKAAWAAADRDEVPIGAVLVCDDEVIATGSNRREELQRVVAHAEVVALENFSAKHESWRVPPGTSLFVTAEPCLMCTGALLWARVENIYYGCTDPRGAGITKVLPLIEAGVYDHRFEEVRGGILADRCGELLKGYFRGKRKLKASSPAPRTESV